MINQKNRSLGEILIDSGILSPVQLEDALRKHRATGKKLGELLIDEGTINEQQLIESLEYQLKIPYIDFTVHSIDPEVPKLINKALARRHMLIPIAKEENQLTVAMVDPLCLNAMDDVNIATGLSVKPALALRSHIQNAVDQYYGKESDEKAVEGLFWEGHIEQSMEIEEDILSESVKKRYLHYNWIMVQEHYTNEHLKESFSLLMRFIKDEYPSEYNRSLAGKILNPSGDLIEQTLHVLDSEKITLNEFLSRYGIIRGSAYGRTLLQKFFLQCSKEGFQANNNLFLEWIKQAEEIPYSQINHYLDVMDVLEYIEEINDFLLQCHGEPGKSKFWDSIQEEYRDKLLQWSKLKDLGNYFGLDTEKFLFWKNYYLSINKTDWYPELGLLILHLPGYVVVDFQKHKNLSYLYKNNAFEKVYAEFDSAGGLTGQIAWPLDPKTIEPVKNAILENQRSEIYELTYERLGKLYIRDYLDMVL